MLNIKVLGPGCTNCHRVHDITVEALEELGVEATIQHVTDRQEYPKYGLLYTPGLVINDKLVCAGRIPSKAEVTAWIKTALSCPRFLQETGL